MKVYIAKDWRGSHVFANEPKLLEHLPAFPPTWSGHELKEFDISGSFTEDELPDNKYVERNIWWSIIRIIK